MKKILYIFLLLVYTTATAQNQIFISGTVKSTTTNLPAPDYPVFIESDDTSYYNIVYTNYNGYYYDIVDLYGSAGISVYTYDCNDVMHMTHLPFPDSVNTVDFEICTDSCNIFADFAFYPDTANFMKIHFLDMSEGTPNLWFWDFDDYSQGSQEQNPVHVFEQEGIYWVSLMVFDTISGCSDMTSMPVFVFNDSLESCKADFAIELDSINPVPYVYHFYDKSEGNITFWEWDFGDGYWSYEQSPTHIYSAPGNYQVCLTVMEDDSVNYCEDTHCVTVSTPSYYNFGGQVFADGYPINNDENDSSNRAIVSIYRNYHNLWRLADQREFWKYGYYWFINKLEGEYIVKINLLEGSPLFNEFAPGYHQNEIEWQKCNLFNLKNSDVFDVNVDLKKLALTGIGTSTISGNIFLNDSCVLFKSNHVPVYLFENNRLALLKYTDDNGDFEFDNLPQGNYVLSAEITGMYSDKVNVSVDFQGQTVDNVEIGLSCSNPDYIFSHKNSLQVFNIENIFPLPADKTITLELNSKIDTRIHFALYNLLGKKIDGFDKNIVTGKNTISYNVAAIPEGLYLIKTEELSGNSLISKKIIIKH